MGGICCNAILNARAQTKLVYPGQFLTTAWIAAMDCIACDKGRRPRNDTLMDLSRVESLWVEFVADEIQLAFSRCGSGSDVVGKADLPADIVLNLLPRDIRM